MKYKIKLGNDKVYQIDDCTLKDIELLAKGENTYVKSVEVRK